MFSEAQTRLLLPQGGFRFLAVNPENHGEHYFQVGRRLCEYAQNRPAGFCVKLKVQ